MIDCNLSGKIWKIQYGDLCNSTYLDLCIFQKWRFST